MWAPGTLVVCVDDSPTWGGRHPNVRRGYVYTILRAVEPGTTCRGTIDNAVLLVEVEPLDGNCAFAAYHFRPVSPAHKQIIRDLLVPVPDPDLIVEEGIDAVLRERLGAG